MSQSHRPSKEEIQREIIKNADRLRRIDREDGCFFAQQLADIERAYYFEKVRDRVEQANREDSWLFAHMLAEIDREEQEFESQKRPSLRERLRNLCHRICAFVRRR